MTSISPNKVLNDIKTMEVDGPTLIMSTSTWARICYMFEGFLAVNPERVYAITVNVRRVK